MGDLTRLTLLERLRDTKEGDSWSEFVDLYDHLVLAWLGRQGVQPQDADDIRQEVLATVFQEIRRFEHNGRPGAFRHWLRKITSNRLHRHWQKVGQQRKHLAGPDLASLADQLADPSSPLAMAWEEEHNRCIVEFLMQQVSGRFSSNSMEAFRRISLLQQPAQQVADDLGISLGAARVAQHRVLQSLKQMGQGWID